MTIKQRIGRWLIPRLPVNRRTFNILRFELNAFRVRVLSAFWPGTRRAVARLATQRGLQVNLGGGSDAVAGWINVDVQGAGPGGLNWDIRRSLPFATASVRRVYASHVVEHIDFSDDVPVLLSEIFRVLDAGGRARIVVPDVVRYLDAYLRADPALWAALGLAELPGDIPTPMAMINHVFHQGGEHQFAYDFETLTWALRNAGFTEVIRSDYRGSANFDEDLDLSVHAPYSLYVEAGKPAADSFDPTISSK